MKPTPIPRVLVRRRSDQLTVAGVSLSRSSKPPTPPAAEPPDGESERPTVVPPFDVEDMARRSRAAGSVSARPARQTPTVRPEFRAEHQTLVDEAELENARLASMRRSSLPPAPGPVEVEEEDLSPIDEARVLLDAGDEMGALVIVAELLRRTPSYGPARELGEECERSLAAKYTRELGSLERVPRLTVSVDQLVALSLDHRAGFLVSFVDGMSSLATIVDVSSMAASEVLRTFIDLSERGIVALD